MELQYSDHKIWIENEQGKVVGEVDFVQRDDGNYDIVHTFVDDSLRGQGAAGKLVKPLPMKSVSAIKRRRRAAPMPRPGLSAIQRNRIS